MKFTIVNGRLDVTLSKRNLLALLQKVDDPYSSKTLVQEGEPGWLIVRCEPDNEHYALRKPGRMSDKTEAFIEEQQKHKGDCCR